MVAKGLKEVKVLVAGQRKIPNTVFVITVSRVKSGRIYYNYFIARPNQYRKGQTVPKKRYTEKVVSVIH
jgi:hypothetical protein